MTQMLREGLRDLAEDAPVVAPRSDAWTQGRRSHRRRVAGGGVAAAAGVLVIAAASVGLVAPLLGNGSDTANQPSVNASQLALPTVFSRPSPWESGTADAGPIGTVAAIGEVDDRQTSWFHSTSAYYAISAADGSYRYLDLPSLALNGAPALSPDGAHIACWTKASADEPATVGGYAVYDTSTGAVTSHAITQAGAIPRQLIWSPGGDQVLAFYIWRPVGHLHRTALAEILDLASGTRHSLPLLPDSAQRDRRDIAWGPNGVSVWRPPSLTTVNPATGDLARDADAVESAHPAQSAFDLAWSADGTRLAMIAQFRDPGGPFLQVNSLGVYVPPGTEADPPRSVQRVSSFDAVYQFLGWRDDTHALVLGVPTEDDAARPDAVPGVYSIDVVSGSFTKVASVSMDHSAWLRGIATGVAANAFVDRPGPASHADPRAVWARVAALLLVAGLIVVVVVVRRRRDRLTDDRSDAGTP
jgi:hypothetical protein